ncbi:MAG: sugar transferase [Desulfobacterota bacterium]|nr:sugar transferase [Thermodesulfobacteriota bacterium]
MKMYQDIGKKVIDFFIAAVGLLILSPLLFIIGLFIKVSDGGPIFFFQQRIGKNFKKFRLIKFRTMVVNAEKLGPAITRGEDPRITKIGRVLRYYKLDELPQLINVLKGDMSIVGPRPEVEKYVNHFRDKYKRILSIKPGITDYAALEYRNEEDILKKYGDANDGYIRDVLPNKIALYEKYLEEMSLLTDMKIICKTLWRIIA